MAKKEKSNVELLAEYKKKATQFEWTIDFEHDEFVAVAATGEYRFPIGISYKDVKAYMDAGAEENALEALRALLVAAGYTEQLDALQAAPLALMSAILAQYEDVVAEVQDATVGES